MDKNGIENFKLNAEKDFLANKEIAKKLKRNNPKNLDTVFHDLHDEVFEKIDCLQCANCCKTTSPIFYQKDIERVAKSLRLKPSQFIEKYLKIDEDDDYVLQQSPCTFLDADNYCTIYNDRPTACREYPHTNRKKMYQLIELSLKNTLVCPAVHSIFKKIKV